MNLRHRPALEPGFALAAPAARYFSPYWLAAICVALGRRAEAMRWLEIATEERCSWIVFIREDPKFAALNLDKEFARIVEATNLPKTSAPAPRVDSPLPT